jgi:hypothetical protein
MTRRKFPTVSKSAQTSFCLRPDMQPNSAPLVTAHPVHSTGGDRNATTVWVIGTQSLNPLHKLMLEDSRL